MSGIHKGMENNKLALFVLMHICVLVLLRPNLNYIYSLGPVMYIKKRVPMWRAFFIII